MNSTQIKTCSQCPLARLIEDDRYVCTVSETGSDTVRGYWEVTRASCHDAIAQLATSDTLEALPVEAPIQPRTPRRTRITNHPFRYQWDIHQGSHDFTASMYNLCECNDCYPSETPKVEQEPQPLPPSEGELEIYNDYRQQTYPETIKFDPDQAELEAYCANDVQYSLKEMRAYKPTQTVTVDVIPKSGQEDSHTTPEQFPPDLNLETLAAEARKEQNEARRLSRVVPVSAVQAIAKVPDYYIERIKSAGTLRPDTALAFMRIWGATQIDTKEIVKTINWLIGAPGFDMANTLLVESLIGVQRPTSPGNQSYFGVDLKVELDPEPEDYHDRY